MGDTKMLQAVQDKLSGNQRDKVDFIQAEQNVLYGDLTTYAKTAIANNPSGYEAEGFKLYEHPNSALMISELRAANGQDKITFIKKGRLLDGVLTPSIKMQRVYRDPLDRTKIVDVKSVSLDNFFNIKKKISAHVQNQINNIESLQNELSTPRNSGGANYEKLKYGLTDLDFVIKNQNPFAASRMVDVSIQFTLESILALDYANLNGFKLRDLITFSKGATVNQEAYGGYSLRLAIGYTETNLNQAALQSHDPDTAKYLSEVVPKINNILLDLELIDYDIAVADSDSSATLTLNYVSYIEDYSKKMAFDIFAGKILSKAEIVDGLKNRELASSLKQQLEVAQSNLKTMRATQSAAREYNRIYNGIRAQAEAADKADGGAFNLDTAYQKTFGSAKDKKAKRLSELRSIINTGNQLTEKTSIGGNAYINGNGRYTVNADVEEIDKDTAEIESQFTTAKTNFDAKVQEINDRLIFQNKIAKYNIILENIFRNNKVYQTELKTSDLVLFSNEATLEFDALVRESSLIAEVEQETAISESERRQSSFLSAEPVPLFSLEDPETASESTKRENIEQINGKMGEAAKRASNNLKKAEIRKDITATDSVKAVTEAKKIQGEGLDEASAIVDARIAGGGPIAPLGDTYKFYYVYLGDIIDAALANDSNGTIYQKMLDANLGIILGSVSVPDPRNPGNTVSVNLADFPISLKYFVRFFKKNVVEKDINRYDVTKFLQDLSTQLVSPAINSITNNFGKSHSNPVQIKITTIPLLGKAQLPSAEIDPSYLGRASSLGTRINMSDPANMYHLQNFADVETVEMVSDKSAYVPTFNYFYMYGTNETGFSMGSSNAAGNANLTRLRAQKGVYSFSLGGEYDAIDIKYSFQKVKKKYQTEMMAARAMEKGEEYREAWNQYDITIEMVGNAIFYPGMHIYSTLNLPDIDYVGADPNLALNLGLEGYYLVTNVENKIQGQYWSTNITAKWQSATAFGKGTSRPLPAGKAKNPDSDPSIDGAE
tara:strand:- start:1665 stop:4676 length:3012 start_codon:yes stop_codon:yes gene_type:complete